MDQENCSGCGKPKPECTCGGGEKGCACGSDKSCACGGEKEGECCQH